MLEQPGFWDDVEHSQQVMKELKNLKDTIEEFETLSNQYEDIGTLIEMAEEENDASLVEEIGNELASFEEKFEEFRIDTLLSEEYDANNAIVTIHAGVGGTEACDWAQMLYRMYTRFAEKKGFSVEVLDYLDGEEAGIKSVTFQVNGLHAYGYLKSEKGVHRLVRISPFNAAGKRQTSFAAVDVMPELDDSIHVEINPEDLRIDTYRSSVFGIKYPKYFRKNHVVQAVPVDSISTRQVLQSVSRISRLELWYNVRMSDPSTATRIPR